MNRQPGRKSVDLGTGIRGYSSGINLIKRNPEVLAVTPVAAAKFESLTSSKVSLKLIELDVSRFMDSEILISIG